MDWVLRGWKSSGEKIGEAGYMGKVGGGSYSVSEVGMSRDGCGECPPGDQPEVYWLPAPNWAGKHVRSWRWRWRMVVLAVGWI